MDFYCDSKICPFEGPDSFVLSVPAEICADEHNCATLFCPHCHKELTVRNPSAAPQE